MPGHPNPSVIPQNGVWRVVGFLSVDFAHPELVEKIVALNFRMEGTAAKVEDAVHFEAFRPKTLKTPKGPLISLAHKASKSFGKEENKKDKKYVIGKI